MRDMRNANILAFKNFSDYLLHNAGIAQISGRRYFSTNDSEKEWLKKTSVKEIAILLPSVRAALLEYDEQLYIVLVGLNTSPQNMDLDVMVDIEVNAGLLTLLVAEKIVNINSSANLLMFDNEIMYQHSDEYYSGNDYSEILNFLEPLQVYNIMDGSLLKQENIYRILLYTYSNNSNNLILKFNEDVLETLSDISLVGSKNISYELILQSLLSTNYKHVFLEFYRLIERLFPIKYLKDFHQKVMTDLNFIQFSAELENITSWRPREEEAIEKIFILADAGTKETFNIFFSSSNSLKDQVQHKYFYKLRNSIVHFRANHEEFALTENQWNKLLFATLYLIDQQYTFNNEFLLN